MQYACDLDHVELLSRAATQSDLIKQIANQTATLWKKPDLYMVTEYALRDAAKNNAFVAEDGCVIINAVVPSIEHPIHMFYRMDEPVNISGGHTQIECHFAFVLLSPEHDGPLHLRRLSRAVRMIQDKTFQKILKQAETVDEVRTHFMYPEERYTKAA